ncbi:methylated-DNA--[protein]-cysteine S-methyltransferase [Bacteroides sp.]
MSNKQDEINFARVADAIEYITRNYREQPSLFDVAEEVNMSAYHFQRLFTEWAGVSPKKFLQYISVNHAKKILKEGQGSLFDAAFETGLSGTGRLHELFVRIEGMTPGEYKIGGRGLTINYNFVKTHFGEILVASTSKGVCYMSFCDDREKSLEELGHHFPFAKFERRKDEFQARALAVFSMDWEDISEVKLHLRGTEFQLKVWETLLKIPMGTLVTYGDIAHYLDSPKASRAVGTAVGDNPVAFLIPCHRVIRATGALGGYRWGLTRKTALIGWEAAQTKKHWS